MLTLRHRDVVAEPRIGIFWVVDDRQLITDLTRISQSHHRITAFSHLRGHSEVWAELQARNLVPPDRQCTEYPRGRVVYFPELDQFLVYADTCILGDVSLTRRIVEMMRLPRSRTAFCSETDYRCPNCQ